MAVVHYLGFVGCVFDRSNSFDFMHFSISCMLGLKKPIHAPKTGFVGGFHPINVEWQKRDTKKAHPCAETGDRQRDS